MRLWEARSAFAGGEREIRDEQKQQMMQAKTQIESLEAALSDERKRSRKKSKIVREMNLLA